MRLHDFLCRSAHVRADVTALVGRRGPLDALTRLRDGMTRGEVGFLGSMHFRVFHWLLVSTAPDGQRGP